ncbi:MAG: hypothetical protein NUW21_01095, partial [Elusimicrobia bacterium]|nr:hypothetical protein [Elusimicrobiota bacterium]
MIVAAGKVPEARITYQGMPCQSGSFSQPYGLAAGTGSVVMPQKAWAKLIVGDPWEIHGASQNTLTESREEPSSDAPPDSLTSTLAIRGPLVFRHGAKTITLPRIYLSDAGVEDAKRSAETVDVGLIRVPLVSVTYLWATRGDICGRYNVLKRNAGMMRAKPLKTDTRDAAPTIDPKDFEPDSLRPDGGAYTLLDMVKLCLSRLPGSLGIVEGAETQAAAGIVPVGLDYADAPLASKVLAELLRAWDFRFVYDPIADRAEIWRVNTGQPFVSEQGVVTRMTFETSTGKIAIAPGSILDRKRSTQHFLKPRSVRVVGRPVIREAKVDLELAGEINGEVVPLDAALAFHGFTRKDAARFVLLPSEAQKRWKIEGLRLVNDFTVSELRRWAFKMAKFRESGFGAGFRPILKYRAKSMIDGTEREPVVWADYHDEAIFRLWRTEIVGKIAAIQIRAVAELERLRPKLDALSELLLARELARANAAGENGLAAFIRELTSLADLPLATTTEWSAAQKRLRAMQRDLIAITNLSDRRREVIYETEERETAIANRYGEVMNPALYKVDDQGNVEFTRLVGHIQYLRAEGQDPAPPDPVRPFSTVREQMALISDEEPTLRILFAYISTPASRRAARLLEAEQSAGTDEDAAARAAHPDLDKSADNIDHFNYLGGLVGGKPVRLNPDNVEPESSANLYPERVAHDL